MPNFRVTWEIDVEADTAHEAARQAHDTVRRHETSATVYEVTRRDTGKGGSVVLLKECDG